MTPWAFMKAHDLQRDKPHRFTVDEYYRMAGTGLLDRDIRVELLDSAMGRRARDVTRPPGSLDVFMAWATSSLSYLSPPYS